MASHLSTGQIEEIVSLIDGWSSEKGLTWEALLRLVRVRLRLETTRQTLSRHDPIALAYRTRKAALRKEKSNPGRSAITRSYVSRLAAENKRLKAQDALHEEQFVRWSYNAFRFGGVTEDELQTPMPSVDRGRTD